MGYATSSNRLTQIGSQPVTSDAAGNQTQDRASRELEYDAQGRLAKVRISGNVAAEYRYNALGQRTHKITATEITTFLYGPDGQLLGETHYSSAGLKLGSQYYLWLDSMPLGGISLSYDANGAIASSIAFYLHSDHLNTPRLATDQNGQEVWRWQSDAFGLGLTTGSTTINLRFPGQYYDSESGLHYNDFRDYDPETGRYVESDPIGLDGGLNTYGYVDANPLLYVDALGLSKTNGKHANKSSPMNVGEFNKNSNPADVQKAIKEAEASGKSAHARALKGLLKVIKRLKSLSPTGLIEQMFEEMCAENPDEPACRVFNPQPSGLWCEENGGNNTPPVFPGWSSPSRPNVIDLGQL